MKMLALPVLVIALLGCGNSDSAGAGGEGGSSITPAACASDPRIQVYATGLSKTSTDGTMKVSFVAAQPAPPDMGGNTWTVHVTDANGKAFDGAAITVKPFM